MMVAKYNKHERIYKAKMIENQIRQELGIKDATLQDDFDGIDGYLEIDGEDVPIQIKMVPLYIHQKNPHIIRIPTNKYQSEKRTLYNSKYLFYIIYEMVCGIPRIVDYKKYEIDKLKKVGKYIPKTKNESNYWIDLYVEEN